MVGFFLFGLAVLLLFSIPFAWFSMLLWNYLVTGVFAQYAIPVLTFGQAWCLYILASILFKSGAVSSG